MPSKQHFEVSSLASDFAKLSATMRTKLAGNDKIPQPTSDQARVCPVCFKRFKRTEHLKRHARSHDPGPYLPCDICDRSFLRSDSLRRHKKIHTRAREEESSESGPGDSSSGKQTRPRIFNRACRPCARARVRCDGQYPCERCVVSEISCERVKKKKFSNPESEASIGSPRSTQSIGCPRLPRLNQEYSDWLYDSSQNDPDCVSISSSMPHDGDERAMNGESIVAPYLSAPWLPKNDGLEMWSQHVALDDATNPGLEPFPPLTEHMYGEDGLSHSQRQSCSSQDEWLIERMEPMPFPDGFNGGVTEGLSYPWYLQQPMAYQPVYV